MNGHHELQHFVDAQEASGTYSQAVAELREGRKLSHWMWFVFPQIAGLGHSATARRFALSGITEARTYLAHPVLGPRLSQCAGILLDITEADPVKILGQIDAQKLQSSMTLFSLAAPDQVVFQHVLDRFFGGAADDSTLRRTEQASTLREGSDGNRPLRS